MSADAPEGTATKQPATSPSTRLPSTHLRVHGRRQAAQEHEAEERGGGRPQPAAAAAAAAAAIGGCQPPETRCLPPPRRRRRNRRMAAHGARTDAWLTLTFCLVVLRGGMRVSLSFLLGSTAPGLGTHTKGVASSFLSASRPLLPLDPAHRFLIRQPQPRTPPFRGQSRIRSTVAWESGG